MKSFLKNLFLSSDKYRYHSEAVVISCFYNPTGSLYRLKAFNQWYETIKHLDHRIVELAIGDAPFELPGSPHIERLRTSTLLWHKEALLNRIIDGLPDKYKYVFWVDADVLFTNRGWLVEGVEALKTHLLIQPFEYCIHMERDEVRPTFNVNWAKDQLMLAGRMTPNFWRSFAANYYTYREIPTSYTNPHHGHVGFAWGIRREVLDQTDLYDKALIGGADHIMADAAVSPVLTECIRKSFTANQADIADWSRRFYSIIQGNIGYVHGDLHHIWHGDIEKRNYQKRIQDFAPLSQGIRNRDSNGLYTTNDPAPLDYIQGYMAYRDIVDDSPAPVAVTVPFAFGGAVDGFGGAGAEGSYDLPDKTTAQENSLNWNESPYFETVHPDTAQTGSVDLTSKDADWQDTNQNWDSHNGIS